MGDVLQVKDNESALKFMHVGPKPEECSGLTAQLAEYGSATVLSYSRQMS